MKLLFTENETIMTNYTFDELEVGAQAETTKYLSQNDINKWAEVSGDYNPLHTDANFAKQLGMKNTIAHGMWGGFLISSLLGSKFPGPGTIYLSQNFVFKSPIYTGDTIRAIVSIKEKNMANKTIILDCQCLNQLGNIVLYGDAKVVAPSKKIEQCI